MCKFTVELTTSAVRTYEERVDLSATNIALYKAKTQLRNAVWT